MIGYLVAFLTVNAIWIQMILEILQACGIVGKSVSSFVVGQSAIWLVLHAKKRERQIREACAQFGRNCDFRFRG